MTTDKILYARFLKENNIYNEQFKKIGEVYIESNKAYRIFDNSSHWAFTEEGEVFWYKKQLDYVMFLLKLNIFYDRNALYDYYKHLCDNYSSDKVRNLEWYIEHRDYCAIVEREISNKNS